MEKLTAIFGFNGAHPMVFTGLDFWVFFTVAYAVFATVAPRIWLRNTFLLLASLFFYFKTSGAFVLLLVFAVVVGYGAAAAMARTDRQGWRRMWLALALMVHLSLLAYFKYAYFIADGVQLFTGERWQMMNPAALLGNALMGSQVFTVDRILLPVGISFFTFQIITYVVDVCRRQLQPLNSLADLGFYISFFPQLVAGPIVRASEFIPQIHQPTVLSRADFGVAIFLILKGLFKKIVIGDYLAINFIDRVFADPAAFSGLENLLAMVAYSIQVYVDFSGYTDVAIGLSRSMGFRLSDNFQSPYKAVSVADFWRRWHISLSSFLRDYLYIPLGGNRRGAIRTNTNLMITMLLGGLWHGASFNFVIWGALNGLALLVYKGWRRISPYEQSNLWVVRAWRVLFTFAFITATRVFFRLPDLHAVSLWYGQVSGAFSMHLAPALAIGFWKVWCVLALGFATHWASTRWKTVALNRFQAAPWWVQALVSLAVLCVIYQSLSAEAQPFIYFQF